MARVEMAPEVASYIAVGAVITAVALLFYKIGKVLYSFELETSPQFAMDPVLVLGLAALGVTAMALVVFAFAYKVIRRG